MPDVSFAFITQTSLVLSGSVLLSGVSVPGKSSFLLRGVDVCGICLREYGEQHPGGESPYTADLCPSLLWVLVSWKEKGVAELRGSYLGSGATTAAWFGHCSLGKRYPAPRAGSPGLAACLCATGPGWLWLNTAGHGEDGGSGQHRAGPALLGSAGRRAAALFQGCGVPVAAGQGWPWGCVPCSNTGYGACRYVRSQD